MEFKEGQWLIRKWRVYGYDIDFAQIKTLHEDSFTHGYFFRFGKHFQDLSEESYPIPLIDVDDRMEFDWRKPTEEEIMEYLILEPKPFKI